MAMAMAMAPTMVLLAREGLVEKCHVCWCQGHVDAIARLDSQSTGFDQQNARFESHAIAGGNHQHSIHLDVAELSHT
jgi:alpha-galactosidase